MDENDEKKSKRNNHEINYSPILNNEIETIKSLIKVKVKLNERKKLRLENQEYKQKKKDDDKNCINDYFKNTSLNNIAKPKIRNYFTCMMCILFDFNDVFTKKNSEIKIGQLNYNELLITFALNMLTQVYKQKYHKIGINSDKPKIYPTFDFPEIIQNTCNIVNICSNSHFNLIINDKYLLNKKIGLHLTLTRNHHISKKLSYIFLKNIIKKFNDCQINYEIPEIVLKSQKIKIQTKLKPFCIFLDYDSIIILKNTSLYSRNTTINGGIFAALKVHNASKITYLDPIIEMIDQVCVDIGIKPLYSERIFHISLFYIKKSDLYLADIEYHNQHISSDSIIENYSFKDYLESKLSLSSFSTNSYSSSFNFSNSGNNHIIWINQLVFRIGIYEYYLLLES